MPATPVTPDVRAFAPEFARCFAAIAGPLAALIAHALLRDPRHSLLIIPLWRRITRAVTRCTRLMATLAAGRQPRRHHTGKSHPATAAAIAIPRTDAWLVRILHHRAAAYASQLAHLLAQPAAVELLATTPAALTFLRPLCRLLGITASLPATIVAKRAEAASPSPESALATSGTAHTDAAPTDTAPAGAVARQAAGASSRPESALAPSFTAPPEPAPAPPAQPQQTPPATNFWRPERPPWNPHAPLDPDLPWLTGIPKKIA